MVEELSVDLGGPVVGFWRRLGGSFIDGLVLTVVSVILALAIGTFGRLLGIAIDAGYFTYFHGRTGQTPGNAALGIRVVDIRDRPGQPVGYGRAAVRWLMSIVSTLAFFLGYFWMLWDPKKQTWHDKAAASLPIRVGN